MTVTLTGRPHLLVTSRPAGSVRPAARTRVFHLLAHLGRGDGAAVLLVDRSLRVLDR